MVIFFISTMFASMAIGIASIKLYNYYNRHEIAKEILEASNASVICVSMSTQPEKVVVGDNDATEEAPAITEISESKYAATESPRKYIFLKYLHGFMMFYSFVMILGAAGAFSSNARTAWPYTASETNSLIGRCFGRNLTAPEAPAWLNSLQCGFGAWCKVNADNPGETNPYYSIGYR